MGMFDYIECKYPLPDGWRPGKGNDLQTKSLGNDLYTHKITRKGYLYEERLISVEEVPLHKRPMPDMPFVGSLKCLKKRYRSYFTGIINFYGNTVSSNPAMWHEYNAKFNKGKLVKIWVVPEPASIYGTLHSPN